jgi:choline-sulfatase
MSDRPNVLLIMSDQHNARVLGCAGDEVVETPNLDRLAAEGASLTNLYSPSPLCMPARMAFMTGQLPSHCGVMTNHEIPSGGRPTLAHAAGAAGYRPYLTGKLHVLGPDQLLGFVDRAVGDHNANYPWGGRGASLGELQGTAGPGVLSLRKSGYGSNAYQLRDELAAEAAVSYLERHTREDAARPFFLSVGLMLPHQPYVATKEDYERYEGRVPPPRVPGLTDVDRHPFLTWWREATGIDAAVPEEVVTRARTAYWGMVDRMDRIIGTILDALDRLQLSEDTLVIYTSDHGEHVGEHGIWWKQTFFDAASRVPGLVRWPGVVPAASVCDRVASLLDVNATILAAIDAPALPRSAGRSLLPCLVDGDAAAWDDLAIAEYCIDAGHYPDIDAGEGFYQRMVRKGRFKYVDYGHQRPQLFDLEADPEEVRDRAGDPELAGVVEELRGIARHDWDPELLKAETRLALEEMRIIGRWVETVQPPDRHRWEIDPDYNALDGP